MNKIITIAVVCFTLGLVGCTTVNSEETQKTTEIVEMPKEEEKVSYIDSISEKEKARKQIEQKKAKEEELKEQKREELRKKYKEQKEKEAQEQEQVVLEVATQPSYSYSTPSYYNYDYDYEEEYVESEPQEEYVEPEPEEEVIETVEQPASEGAVTSEAKHTPSEFRRDGVYYEDGYRWTWYSENVLPGGGLDIPGRHTDEQGYVKDEDGYICLASDDLEQGTVVDTPFGSEGKVYDSGCDSGTLDVYVGW